MRLPSLVILTLFGSGIAAYVTSYNNSQETNVVKLSKKYCRHVAKIFTIFLIIFGLNTKFAPCARGREKNLDVSSLQTEHNAGIKNCMMASTILFSCISN